MNKTKKSMISLIVVMFVLSVMGVYGAHDNNASLEPEWSPAGETVDYTVIICNQIDGGDPIDEVRIYNNLLYTNFDADENDGWYRHGYDPIKKFYQYTANGSDNYILEGDCEIFTFSAKVPSASGISTQTST